MSVNMLRFTLRASMLTIVVLAKSINEEMIQIPGGFRVPRSCVHVVPNGVVVDESYVIPKCERGEEVTGWNETMIQIYASDVHAQTNETQFQSMTSNVVVPPLPTETNGQTVYFWYVLGFISLSPPPPPSSSSSSSHTHTHIYIYIGQDLNPSHPKWDIQ